MSVRTSGAQHQCKTGIHLSFGYPWDPQMGGTAMIHGRCCESRPSTYLPCQRRRPTAAAAGCSGSSASRSPRRHSALAVWHAPSHPLDTAPGQHRPDAGLHAVDASGVRSLITMHVRLWPCVRDAVCGVMPQRHASPRYSIVVTQRTECSSRCDATTPR